MTALKGPEGPLCRTENRSRSMSAMLLVHGQESIWWGLKGADDSNQHIQEGKIEQDLKRTHRAIWLDIGKLGPAGRTSGTLVDRRGIQQHPRTHHASIRMESQGRFQAAGTYTACSYAMLCEQVDGSVCTDSLGCGMRVDHRRPRSGLAHFSIARSLWRSW